MNLIKIVCFSFFLSGCSTLEFCSDEDKKFSATESMDLSAVEAKCFNNYQLLKYEHNGEEVMIITNLKKNIMFSESNGAIDMSTKDIEADITDKKIVTIGQKIVIGGGEVNYSIDLNGDGIVDRIVYADGRLYRLYNNQLVIDNSKNKCSLIGNKWKKLKFDFELGKYVIDKNSKNNCQKVVNFSKKSCGGCKNYVTVEYVFGFMHETGVGLKQDYVQAFNWYKKAADKNDSYAQNSLAELYEKGLGVEKDHIQAIYWYKKAAEQSYQPAIDALKKMNAK